MPVSTPLLKIVSPLLDEVPPIEMPSTKITKYGSVWVQGYYMHRQIERMFLDHGGFTIAAKPQEADFVCWTGGDDINPLMYGEQALPCTAFSSELDLEDVHVYRDVEDTAIKIGICRGAQLLNVLNGGKLWQDVDKHNNGKIHPVRDTVTGETHNVNSLHHQAMILPKDYGELVAYCRLSEYKLADGEEWHESMKGGDLSEVDVEVAWYKTTRSLCFQPHPEFQDRGTKEYFFNLIDRYCLPF